MISLLRIDERLIHGQVAYAWSTSYKSEALMVITTEKKNDLEKMSLKLACPKSLKCFIVTVDEAVELLSKYAKRKIFIVTNTPNVVLALINAGVDIETVNVGGIYHKEGREPISKTVFVDDNMKTVFREINDKGTKLEVRATPTDKSINLIDLI